MITSKQCVLVAAFALLLGAVALWGFMRWLHSAQGSAPALPPAKVADYLHAVIQANRTVYATHVVEKLQSKGVIEAAEHWRQEVALPLPAQFLIETGRLVSETGNGVKYRLMSLWPIYVWNAPSTDFERKGLEAVITHPETPYSGIIRNGQKRYFQAIYPDRAIAQNCIDCHNSHMNSPRQDFKLNEVMGGIVITIPVDE